MYTTHYPLTDDERKSFDLVMRKDTDWDDLNTNRQQAIKTLTAKYPDIADTAVWVGGSDSSYSAIPLSQQSSIPDRYSEVSKDEAWDAFYRSKGTWGREDPRAARIPIPPSPAPMPQSVQAEPQPGYIQRPQPTPFSPRPNPINAGYPYYHHPAPSTTRPLSPPGLGGFGVNSTDPRPNFPPAPTTPGPPGQAEPTTESIDKTKQRNILLAHQEASRQRFVSAMHAAVDAEGDLAKYTAQLQHLDLGDGVARTVEVAKDVTPAQQSASQKRRERKKKLDKGQGQAQTQAQK